MREMQQVSRPAPVQVARDPGDAQLRLNAGGYGFGLRVWQTCAFNQVVATSSQAHSCYARNWKTSIDGRAVDPAEEPRLAYLTQLSLAGQLSIKDLILSMVTDDGFLNRLP